MADVGTLVMKIKADISSFEKGMNKASSMVGKVGKVALVAGGVAATGLAVGGAKALELGADAEEMLNKYNVVFDGMTDDVDDWAENFSKKVGRSKTDVKKAVSNLGDLQQGLGMTKDESFDLSSQIVELATDLASFNNVQDEDAINAISKAMMGEAESAKQLGLLLNVDRVKDYAESQGLVYEELTDAEKAQQVYNLAVEQSQNAIGDAERSSDSYTNQMKAFKSGVKDAGVELGMQLLPAATKVMGWLNDKGIPIFKKIIDKIMEMTKWLAEKLQPVFEKIGDWWEQNGDTVKEKAMDMFEGIVKFGMKAYDFFKDNILPIIENLKQWWDENGDTVKEKAKSMFDGIVEVATTMWEFFTNSILPVIQTLWEVIQENFPKILEAVKPVFESIVDLATTLWNFFKDNLLPIIEALWEKVDEYLPLVGDIFTTIIGGISTVISGIVTEITDFIDWVDKAVEAAKEFFSAENTPSQQRTVDLITQRAGQYGYSNYGATVSGQKANGGAVRAGQTYLVGERGAEMFTPSRDGFITSGGGSSITVNVYALSPDEAGAQVVEALHLQGVGR